MNKEELSHKGSCRSCGSHFIPCRCMQDL